MKTVQKYLLLCGILSMQHMSANHTHHVFLEAKGAYFFPTDKLFRKIYGLGSGIYGGELTVEFGKHIYGFLSCDFFTKKGRSIGLCDCTKITFMPIGMGLKYLWCAESNASPYIGLGVVATHLAIRDYSPFVIPNRNKWGVGGVVKLGTFIHLPCSWFIDLFANYHFTKIDFDNCKNPRVYSHKADLSGVSVGVGIGYHFN